VLQHQGNETFKQRMSLGSIAEVYDAELTGLVVGLGVAIMKAESLPEIHHIHVYADNMSAIRTVPDPSQGQLVAYTKCYNGLKRTQITPSELHGAQVRHPGK